MRLVSTSFLVLVLLAHIQSSFAAECVPWHSDFSSKNDLRIGKITINAGDIFDLKRSKENTALHRFANKVHIKTKSSVLSNQLLFAEDDLFSPEKLTATERALRKQKYIKSARVKAIELCGKQVNISVQTYDNWTLTPGLTFSRLGGKNRTGVKIQEHNLLGFGKSLSFKYKKNSKRSSRLFYYKDPQLFGTRTKLSLNLQDNSDGKGYGFSLGQPFYELDSKKSWGLNTSKIKQDVSLYQASKEVNKISEEIQQHSVSYAWSKKSQTASLGDASILRFKVGWSVNTTDFLAAQNNASFQPYQINESYPWFEVSSLQEHYLTKKNFRTMGIVEDITLGQSLTLGLGFLHQSFGSDDNQLKVSASYSKGYALTKNNLAFLALQTDAYLGEGKRQGETYALHVEYDHFNGTGNDLTLKGKLKISNNLVLNQQLLLGGESGLRAYPSAYQTGNKSILIQAEKRIHYNWYPLRLVKFGAVMFADVGTAWGAGNDAKILADVGVGLRLFPTRSSTGSVLHFDFAFPLLDKSKVDKYQFSIRTSQSF